MLACFIRSDSGRSSVLGLGLMETTTTVMKRAVLQEVGASTAGGKEGQGQGRRQHAHHGSDGVMQVKPCASVVTLSFMFSQPPEKQQIYKEQGRHLKLGRGQAGGRYRRE